MAGIAGNKSKIKTVAAIAAALIFAAVILPFLIDADQFRPQVESRLSAELVRDVRLGKLRLSLFSGRLSVDDISIMDNPEFGESPFVTARAFHIGIKLMPLIFSKKIHITKIALDHPSIYLRQSSEGEWNISNMGVVTGDEADTSAEKPEQATDITIERLQITDGRVEIIKAGKKTSAYEKVNLSVDNLSRDAASHFILATALQGGGAINLNGTFGPLNQDDTLMTPFEAVLKINHLDSAVSGFIPADAFFFGLFDFSGDLNSDGITAQSKGKASVANLRLVADGAQADKPVSLDYDLRYDLKKKTGMLSDATVGLGQAAMRFYGNFDAGGDVANIKMTLKGNGIPVEELQEFLPSFGIILPNGAAIEGGTLDTEIIVEGFLNNPTMDVTVEISGTRLVGFDLGEKIAPVANFAGLKAGMDTQIDKFYMSARWTANGITVNNIQLVLPAFGEISGSGTISPRHELDLSMRMVVSNNILNAFTKGKTIDLRFFIRGSAADPEFIPDYKDAARSLIDAFLKGNDSKAGPANKPNQIMDSLKGVFR